MKKSKKLVVLAVSLVVVGLIISIAGLFAVNFDFSKMSLARLTANIHNVEEDFTKISIDTAVSDVCFELSGDGTCQVICLEEVNYVHKVSVENNTLTITTEDNRMWYEQIGVNFGDFHNVTVRLPKEAYQELIVNGHTANVEVPKGFSFGLASVTTTTGDVKWQGSTVNELFINVTTGEIYVNDTGCYALEAKTSTGDICLVNTVVTRELIAKTSTGDVRFDASDGKAISIQTGTGDVAGTLLSNKIFVVDNNTGKVVVPEINAGTIDAFFEEGLKDENPEKTDVDGTVIYMDRLQPGVCQITTSTGDIYIELT